MNTELFQGNPESLQARLAVLTGGANTINNVILTHVKGEYIIIWS